MTKVRLRTIKATSIGIMLMGITHDVATFTPLIASKLATLDQGAQRSFTYFSLMCGALLIVGGALVHALAGKTETYTFLVKPYILLISVLALDGTLAVIYMPHNPFAWMIFTLTTLLLLANAIPSKK